MLTSAAPAGVYDDLSALLQIPRIRLPLTPSDDPYDLEVLSAGGLQRKGSYLRKEAPVAGNF